MKHEKWVENSPASYENSYTVLSSVDEIEMSFELQFDPSEEYGWFEIYDTPSGGTDFYGSGGLWFNGNELVDYDGVFSLPTQIITKLEGWGVNADYAK